MDQTKPHLHNTQAGAILPLAQSAITAALIFLLVLLLTFLLDWRKPLIWAAVIGLLSWVAAWLLLQAHWFKLTTVERWLGIDLDGDGYTGEPPQEQIPPIRVDLVTPPGNGNGYQRSRLALHATPEQLRSLARGLILEKQSLAENVWAGSSRPFSLPKFRKLRGELAAAGLVAEISGKDHRQGFALTASGRAVMRKILMDQLPLPTATDDEFHSGIRTYAVRTHAEKIHYE